MTVLSKNKTIDCFACKCFHWPRQWKKITELKIFSSVSIPHPVCSFFLFILFSLTWWNPHHVPLASLESAQNKGGAIRGLLVTAIVLSIASHCTRLSGLPLSWSLGVARLGQMAVRWLVCTPTFLALWQWKAQRRRGDTYKPLGTKTMEIKMLTFEKQWKDV